MRTLAQIDEAAEHYRQAVEIQPDFAEAHTGLGNALQELGQFDQALASHRRTLALNPNAAESHQNMGNTLLDLYRLDEGGSLLPAGARARPRFWRKCMTSWAWRFGCRTAPGKPRRVAGARSRSMRIVPAP